MVNVTDVSECGLQCTVHSRGCGPVVFWMTSDRADGSEDAVFERTCALTDLPFELYILRVRDWNSDLSPWEFDAGGTFFPGNGKAVLDSVLKIASDVPDGRPKGIIGYSLAGLFSLWAGYETDMFSSVGCCSGSLWFGGWDDYADSHTFPKNTSVYLSLGGKEPGSGNALTASIGDRYSDQRDRFRRHPPKRVKFESNPGGHFSDPSGRVAKGIAWMVEQMHADTI